MNHYIVSTATLPMALGYKFTDYQMIPEVYKQLNIDGLEFVFLPEWDQTNKPLTPTSANWLEVEKVSTKDLVCFIKENNLPITNIHVNRDYGTYLSRNDMNLISKGQKILDENIKAAIELNAELVVIHLWDTFKTSLQLPDLINKLTEVTSQYKIDVTIENLPISDNTLTNEKIWHMIKEQMPNAYFTLDLNWCSLYNDLDLLMKFQKEIKNVHVHGYLNDQIIYPNNGVLDFEKSLTQFKKSDKNITLELMRPKSINDFKDAIDFMRKYT